MLHEQLGGGEEGPEEMVVSTDAAGDAVDTLASYRSEKWQGAYVERLRFTHLAPELVLAPWGEGGGAFGYPTAYRVSLVGADCRVERVIEVNERGLEVDSHLEDALLEDMSSDAPGMTVRDLDGEVYFPEFWPFFDALFSDENGNLFVQRSQPLPQPGADLLLDFFTREGMHLFRLRAPVGDIQAVRNGFLYSRRFNRDENVAQLVRYRILNWNVITEAVSRHQLPTQSNAL